MKNLTFLLFFLNFINYTLSAQVSIGGTPKSESSRMDLATIPTITLPAQDNLALLEAADAKEQDSGFYSFGTIIPTQYNLTNSGKWSTLPNGDRLWILKITSDNAKSLTLYFKDFKLAVNSTMFVYNSDRSQVHGAFSSHNNPESGDFAISLIHGSEIIIEYSEPARTRERGHFTIDGVGHAFRGESYPAIQLRGFGDSDTCLINANCSQGTGWGDQKRATARIQIVLGSAQGWCSGSLVNNVRQDCKQYFLSAYHCGGSAPASDISQWIFYFNYESADCNNPATAPAINSVVGGIKVSSSEAEPNAGGSDFLLLELPNPIPAAYNVYYAGWNANNTPSSSGASIHHPKGDIKKISLFNTPLQNVSLTGVAATHWEVVWSEGVTEPGSSGSGIFDSDNLLIGNLTGGDSFCDTPGASDYYGKMSHHWESNGTTPNKRLKDWLDPDNTGTLTLNGINASDCTISAIAIPELNEFRLSPNPSRGTFNLQMEIPQNETVQVLISNSLGQLLESHTIVDHSVNKTFDIAKYSNGIYFISIRSGKRVKTKKLILSK